jgi:nucleotide-binding universal stress UspA family protein
MELVVALIGLNLGILSPAMYASIVIMAIATSFIAPVLLRLVLHMVKMSPEEKARMAQTSQRTVFSPTRLKALLPTAGGPNALHAGRFAGALVRGEPATLTLLFVQAAESILLRIKRLFRPDPAGQNLQQHLELIKTYADERHARVEINKATDSDAVGVICREAKNGYDLILLGAGLKNPLRSGVTVQLLEHAPCHVAIMRGIGDVREPKNILVPTNGSYFTTAALELAVLYAERVGATVTVLYTMESAPDEESTFADPDAPIARGFRRMMATTLLANLSPLISKTTAKVTVVVAESAQLTEPVVRQAKSGIHQLVVIGAEDRAVQHRLSAGYDLDKVLDEAPCSVLVVVPRMGGSDHKSNH